MTKIYKLSTKNNKLKLLNKDDIKKAYGCIGHGWYSSSNGYDFIIGTKNNISKHINKEKQEIKQKIEKLKKTLKIYEEILNEIHG